ncbi:MBL fold metallo-hydrolase [Saccharopolyspora sp. HNM0983]|uniref:MBL fold metallo-hydrolase n=1 Tax=Saccharopolyspora montiporae TaxID=2781240 RepID=A0A929BCG6_9PSEU|nr:MBL fold metallo-hydrolase [Saccharopolyspora sp. HNM0983]MBE9375491.1 MBL fold metallo-hydrolase [Saccharopolyspora sp. HNM0983]
MTSAPDRHAWTEAGVFEVADGVHRIPLPMPGDGLRAVNVYALRDGDGIVLIDSGWALDSARERLESALAQLGSGLDRIRRFLITHAHRDHYSQAVQLRAEFGTPISLGAGELPSMRKALDGDHSDQPDRLLRWGARDLLGQLAESFGERNPERDRYLAEPDEWLAPDARIELESRTLCVVPTPGHTRGHVVFADEQAGLLFSGDHVLPHITPSIGAEVARSAAPLAEFLDSLQLLAARPDARLLPAHGPPTGSVHERVAQLLDHHEARLDSTAQVVRDGASTAYEAALRLGWTRRERALLDLDLVNQVLAVGETEAHLEVLVRRGVLRSEGAGRPERYRPAT